MDIIRRAILTACLAGIISSAVSAAAIGSSGKKVLKLIVNCIVVICLLKPVTGIEFNDEIDYSFATPSEMNCDDLDVRTAELSVKIELEKLLTEKGIAFSDVSITCEKDEYNVISVKDASILVPTDEDRDKLNSFIAEYIKDNNISVRTEVENESGALRQAQTPCQR